jgi:hypothetical protein
MKKDRALVRSKIVRATDANVAKLTVMETLDADGFVRIPIQIPDRYIIRAYRFYKKLSAEPVKKTYLPLDKLFPAKRAVEIMTEIENPKKPIVLRPEDLKPKFGDPAPATIVDPTMLPQDHPDHVCTDKCYDIVEIAPKDVRLPAEYFDTSNVAAGQPSPYLFPDKPLVPTKDAVFDGFYEVVAQHGFEVCRWHGGKYIDLRDGRCTATDAGSGFFNDTKYQTELSIKRASGALQQFGNAVASADEAAKEFADVAPRNIDLDEAAPVLYPAPTPSIWRPVTDPKPSLTALDDMRYDDEPKVYDDSGFRRDPAQAVERSSKAPLITLATIAAIVGLVLAYFHWFKH